MVHVRTVTLQHNAVIAQKIKVHTAMVTEKFRKIGWVYDHSVAVTEGGPRTLIVMSDHPSAEKALTSLHTSLQKFEA